jgi:hypothetical protein
MGVIFTSKYVLCKENVGFEVSQLDFRKWRYDAK